MEKARNGPDNVTARQGAPVLGRMLASAILILVSATYAAWQHLGQLSRSRPLVVRSHPHSVRDALAAFQKTAAPKMAMAAPAAAAPARTAAAIPLAPSSPVLTASAPAAAPVPSPEPADAWAGETAPPPPTPPSPPVPSERAAPPASAADCSYDLPAPPSEASLAFGGSRTMPLFSNGEFTGRCAETDWGHLQVRAIVRMGLLVDVQFLLYPEARSQSGEISAWALPILAEEAIQRQSAAVDIVTQATFTSTGFRNSLASALLQAKVHPGER